MCSAARMASAAMVRVGGDALAGDEAAAPDEVQVRNVVAPQIHVDHARARIGAHPVGPDLVAGVGETGRADLAQPHGGQDPARDVLGLVEGLPLVPAQSAVNVGRGAAEIVPHVRGEGHGVDASRAAARSTRGSRASGRTRSRTCRRSASPESPLATAICSGVGPAEFRNSRRKAPRVARSRSIANWRDMAVENPMR